MFGCSKIKYVKPSLVTYHLSSVTCLILQPWLGLGTWFFWQWVLKRSTCGADRHVIAWLVFLLLFSTDFFSLQHWYFLSPSIWFIEVWDERSWATFWTASSGAMCISHLMWLGIALHVHCHRLFIWCALMCIHCHRLFPDSSKVRGFARNNPAKSVKRGGQILDGEVQIFFIWHVWHEVHFVCHEVHFVIQTIPAGSRHADGAEGDHCVRALCGGVREAPEVPPQDDVGGLPPDVPLCLHGNCMCLCKTMVSKSNMMMWLDCMGYWSNKMSLGNFLHMSPVTCQPYAFSHLGSAGKHRSAMVALLAAFMLDELVFLPSYHTFLGRAFFGWDMTETVDMRFHMLTCFNCWVETVDIDWDMWFHIDWGCHQSHGKWKRVLWARNALRSWRQLGWNRNFTHSLLVSLITICGFYIMPLTPQLPITLYSLKASTCSIQLLSSVITCSNLSWMMEVMMILEQRLRSSTQATA